MNTPIKLLAIIGSYRKGGMIDATIDEMLAAAREAGADTAKIYLLDKHIEFCTNCRTCTQQVGETRGICIFQDDMTGILVEIERSDVIVLCSPVNFWTVTAVMKRFIERLVCLAYWPWGMAAPKPRIAGKQKRAVVVTSSAAPAFVARLGTQLVSHFKKVARLLGARVVGVISIGLAASKQHQKPGESVRKKAWCLGRELAAGNRD